MIKAKVNRENICKLGTLDATNLGEHVFFTFIQEGEGLQGRLNSFVYRVTLALLLVRLVRPLQSHEFEGKGTCKLIKAKVDRQNISKLGTLDETNLEEHLFFSFVWEGKELQGRLNSFVDRVT